MNVTVVKLGGSLLEDAASRSSALAAIARAAATGERLVVVHGGGKKIDELLGRLGIAKRSHAGLRITDAPTLEIVIASLAGIVNTSLTSELQSMGIAAAGISGVDGETLVADPHPPIDEVDLELTGKLRRVDPHLTQTLLAAGYTPVIASVAQGESSPLNVNADAAAAAIAGALGAKRLIFLTDVEGVLGPDGSLIATLRGTDATALLASNTVHGGMRPKLEACCKAIAHGVGKVVIAGPRRHASALLNGIGGTDVVAA